MLAAMKDTNMLNGFYFKKQLLINRYTIFVRDIEPKGFDLGADG